MTKNSFSVTLLSIKNRLINSKLIQDSFWSLLGNVIGRGLALAAGIFIARFLGKEVFGEYGMIKSTILSIATFSSFGLGYTATKFVADFKINSPEYVEPFLKYANRLTLIFCGIMAIALFISADYIARGVLEAPHLYSGLRILSILIIFNGLNTTQIGILAGFGKFKEIAKVNSIIGAITFFFSIAFTYYFGLNGALLALLLSQIFNWYLNLREVKRNIPEDTKAIKNDKFLLKKIIGFSTPVALQESAYSVANWISSLILIIYATYSDLGMYNAALQWFFIVLFIPGILRNVVLSHLSGTTNEWEHNRIMKITVSINFLMTLLPALLVFLFSDMISDFYGSSFQGLGRLITIAVFTTIFISISNVYAQAYMSKGQNWLMLIFRVIRDFGKIFLFYILLKNTVIEGAEAMLYSTLFLSIIFLAVMVVFYKRD